MDFKLLSVKRDLPGSEMYSVELSATHYEPDQSLSHHFAHFTIRFSAAEIANLTVDQIEASAIEQAKQMHV